MIMGEKGCESGTPGIGDIAYVKDLQTEEIVSTSLRCSQFGVGHNKISMIGWVSKLNRYKLNRQKGVNLYVRLTRIAIKKNNKCCW